MSYTVGFKHGGVCYYGNDFETACRLVSELRANVFAGAPIKPSLVVERFPWGVRTAEALLALSLDYAIRDIDELSTSTSQILAKAQAKIDERVNFDRDREEAILRVQAAQRATLQGFRIGDVVDLVSGAGGHVPLYIVSAGSRNGSIGLAPRDDRKATLFVTAEEIRPYPKPKWIGTDGDPAIDAPNPLQLTEDERRINDLAGELKAVRGELRHAQAERDRARKEVTRLAVLDQANRRVIEAARTAEEKTGAALEKVEAQLLEILRTGDTVGLFDDPLDEGRL